MSLKANIFVIPNSLSTLDRFPGFSQEKIMAKCDGVLPDDLLVQLWYTGEGVDNWCSHDYGKGGKGWVVSEFVPARWIKDLKEGETVTWSLPRGEVTVTANQLGYRYKRFGRFEDVVQGLINRS